MVGLYREITEDNLSKLKGLNNIFQNIILTSIWYIFYQTQFLKPNSINVLKKSKIPIILNQNGVFYPGWYDGDWKKKFGNVKYLSSS